MAALNFPNSPTLNDIHTENNASWKWDGTSWIRQGDSGAQGAQGSSGLTLNSGSRISTASINAAEWTSIPSTARIIYLGFEQVSGQTSNPQVQLGDSGGYETSGYFNRGAVSDGTDAVISTAFLLGGSSNTVTGPTGLMILTRCTTSTNTWFMSFVGYHSGVPRVITGGGFKTLSGTLDRVRVRCVANNLDGGAVTLTYA